MRIGILTVPFNNNYGGFLQAFALKKVLTDMGHEVIFISRRRNKVNIPLIKYIIGYPYYRFWEYKQAKRQAYLNKYTDEFKKKYLEPLTEDYYTTKQLSRCLKYGFDAVVVGSDQVWRYRYAKQSIDDFYCNFLEGTNIKRLSYAASFGTDEQEYPEAKLRICAELLKSFSFVSVREQDGKKLLMKYFGLTDRQINIVLDPTLLLPINSYKEIFKDIEPTNKKYVFSYILDKDEEKKKLISFVCREKGFMEISMVAQTDNINKMEVIEPVDLWLSRIYNSDFVVTDSFHGTVFSILFNKPFIVYGNKVRGTSRFDSLLGLFKLESRYIESFDEVNPSCISSSIDWDKVNTILKYERERSLSYLGSILQ